tara:strand:- start:306 stop:809 length:504 start_codon:yes stop_codon:yes gene_type:complete
MTAYTEFVKEWAKRNGVTYMCAIGKQGLKDDYKKSKQIVNKKGRAVKAVNSYNDQGGFRPREKRTQKPKEKVPVLKRRVTRELENPIQLSSLVETMEKKKANTDEIKRKAALKAQLSRTPKKRESGVKEKKPKVRLTGRALEDQKKKQTNLERFKELRQKAKDITGR